MASRILIVEDEKHLAEALAHNLKFEGYETTVVGDGEAAIERLAVEESDLVVLDVMLPGISGFEVCERLREMGNRVPVLFLTARNTDSDRLEGLRHGGDDYMTKPFLLEELVLRIKGILRRQEWYQTPVADRGIFRFGDCEVNFRTFRAKGPGGEVQLTEKECMLMKLLVERQGQVVSRELILEKVWGYKYGSSSRTIDNFIVRLRRYFEPDPRRPRFVHSVRGVGYRFTPEGES
ncbi:MAG: winged-helix transcriptional response regulator [Acidobacteria bacterium]|jgi:DNA-binding response OmpR family regulator|nr:winged-helix transcriptional response regulator [Acidobacteriota bacterium]